MNRHDDRDRRIAELMEENRGKSALEASRGYCAALVDGLMAVERAIMEKACK